MKIKLIATLALTALLGPWAANAGHFVPEIEVDVVGDHGGYLPVYPTHRRDRSVQRAYLEANVGERYAIRVHNPSGERVAVVVAVDGRNIISGERSELSRHERMYVLGPYATATYRGWRSSRNRVNRFYFTEQGDSYAEAFGDRSAMGVIAVAAFREKRAHRQYYAEPSYEESGPAPYDDAGRRGRSEAGAAAPSGKSRDSARMQKHGEAEYDSQPGTGYGEGRYSPSRVVEFKPSRRPYQRVFLKYEWRETLCERGIARCYEARNRFWKESYRNYRGDRGYAPPPPRHGNRRW